MTDRDDFDEQILRPARAFDEAPPPSAELTKAIQTMAPVRTRTRFGAFAAVALLGLIGPTVILFTRPLRRDLAALPLAWVVFAAALWASAFVGSLLVALVPRPADVLPAPARASRVSLTAMMGLLLFGLLASVQAPNSMLPAERGWSLPESCIHCALFVIEIAAVFLAAGMVAVRRLAPVGGRSIGLALGVAGGAMGGLVLHFICPFAATAHVVLGHVGGMILAGAAGALLLAAFSRLRR
jgi:hypothetical protein